MQQLAGLFGVEFKFEFFFEAIFQSTVRALAWQFVRRVLQLLLPVAEVVFEGWQMILQTRDPMLISAGFRLRTAAGVEVLQIFQQHAPGNTVHRQVMDHQQQTFGAVSHRHP
ncbi:hypothetical protein D3C71_947780 [compost metagenome]